MLPDLPDDHDINHLLGALCLFEKKGVAIDGGAHRGIWTRILSDRFAKVYAFEPWTDNFLKIPDMGNVTKVNCALGLKEGTFLMSPGKDNTGQMHFTSEIADIRSGNAASVIKLDSLDLDIDFLKLDVEGYELFALPGAKETIERCKPAIMVEMNGLSDRYGYSDEELRIYLSDIGYKEAGKWNKDYLFVS